MTRFEKCGPEIGELIDQVIDLAEVGVRIDALWQHPDFDTYGKPIPGTGLKHRGYPAQAVIKITNLKDRVKGMGDAELLIASHTWKDLSEGERIALIDHELQHLEPVIGKHHEQEKDDAGRPKLTTRSHDIEFGWFNEIARRHGVSSLEVKGALALARSELGQLYLPGIVESSATVTELRSKRRKRADRNSQV